MSASLERNDLDPLCAADGPLSPVACAAVFDAHPDVARSALVAVDAAGRREPVVCVELRGERSAAERAQIADELWARAAASPATRGLRTLLFHPRLPLEAGDAAAIDRPRLAAWADAQLGGARSRRGFWRTASVRLVPVGGWLFIVFGLVWPLQHPIARGIWLLDVFLSVGVHSLQLFVSIPRGKKAGYSAAKAVIYTLAFGAAWWKFIEPLPTGIYAAQGDAPRGAS